MRCFNHHQEDAVSQCFMCHKGLCKDCHKECAQLTSCGAALCNETMTTVVKSLTGRSCSLKITTILLFFAGICFITMGIFSIQYDTFQMAALDLGMILLGVYFVQPALLLVGNLFKKK